MRSSIRSRTATNLIILSFVIIAFFWLAQILIFNFASSSMNALLISNIGRDLIDVYEGYPSPEFRENLKTQADNYGMNIIFFSADIDTVSESVIETYIIYSVSPFSDEVHDYGKSLDWNDQQYTAFFINQIFKGEREFSYTLSSPSALIFGAQFTDPEFSTTIYAYFESYRSTSNIDFITTLIQLIIASLVCIIVAVVLSLFYSRQFTGPIIQFSKAAELMAKGKYDNVRFKQWGIKEIDSLSASLTNAATQIKQTDDFRREFLANITHDLRTPITMMRGYAEMIRDISGDNKVKRTSHAQIIIDESERLSLLVEDILLMSKLEAGTLVLNKTAFDISMLTSTVIERFKIKTIKEGYKFSLNLAQGLMVTADMQRVEQVLYNLVANAVNYTGQDKCVFVKAFRTLEGKARVEIRDTGKGILPEDIDLIWDRYYRVNQNTRKIIGSGIGLNIVKGILESHGAKFGVESKRGEGTVFWFEFD